MINSLYPTFRHWSEKGSVYIISDTHFEDEDCKYMDPDWIDPEEHFNRIKESVHKNDTLIHLGDVGNAKYIDKLKCHKVLITGNHDVGETAKHFHEVYDGPLFIADRILLSHEPIDGLESFCLNIHGHDHDPEHFLHYIELDKGKKYYDKINLAANVAGYTVFDLGSSIKNGILSQIPNYHRLTIDAATAKKEAKND